MEISMQLFKVINFRIHFCEIFKGNLYRLTNFEFGKKGSFCTIILAQSIPNGSGSLNIFEIQAILIFSSSKITWRFDELWRVLLCTYIGLHIESPKENKKTENKKILKF